MAPQRPPQPPYPPTYNAPALPNSLPYFTPAHATSPGTPATSKSPTPTIFTPLRIRATNLRNRIVVAPMCQYSAAAFGPLTGALTDYHVVHLGHYALKGASLVFIEATGVQANGRISPNCPGIWDDCQIEGVKRVSDFVKSQGALVGIQLAHAGRKASTVAPWVSASQPGRKISVRAGKEVGGWEGDVVGPMGGETELWDGKKEGESGYCVPRQLSVDEIGEVVKDFGRAAERAVKAGVEVVEIHAAHGYLIGQFLSPVTNRRTDAYGGSWEGRVRMLKEVVAEVRAKIPEGMPLFLRVSSTEWLEGTDVAKQFGGSWTVDDTIRLAKLLPSWGVDLLDVSSGGNHPAQKINMFASKDYQIKIAARVREEMKREGHKLFIGAVGLITEAEQARSILEGDVEADPYAQPEGADDQGPGIKEEAEIAKRMVQKGEGKEPMADVILVARQFMREPEWVLKVAWRLGVDIAWPSQFLRVRFPKL